MSRRDARLERRRESRGGRTAIIVWSSVAAVVLGAAVVIGVVAAAVLPPVVADSLPTASPTVSPIVSPEASPEASPERTETPEPNTDRSPADTPCDTRVTMSVWAHYDDDIIFMNPGVQEAITAGDCVRTVFLTAGDAGKGKAYAKGRELGILRAYNDMRGKTGFWHETAVVLRTGVSASMWSPDDDTKISLVFLRLPDGFLDGSGFDATGHSSLAKLANGTISSLSPIEGGAAVTKASLTASIAELIGAFHPAQLWTHVPSLAEATAKGDHSDHVTTGTLVRAAAQEAGYPLSQVFYLVGYPSEKLPVNVAGQSLRDKVETFRVYAANDSVVACEDYATCLEKRRFGDWLQRHYVKTDAELFPAG